MENINIETEKFSANIKQYIQSSDLPIAVIHYVIKDIYSDVRDTYYKFLNDSLSEEKTSKEKDNE